MITAILNISEIILIFGVVISAVKYTRSQEHSRINYTMHVVAMMQKDILDQGTLNGYLADSRSSLIKEIKSKSLYIYIKHFHNNEDVSEQDVNDILSKVSKDLTISERDLQFNARLRIIGISIIKLNRWAAYINSKRADFNMSLIDKQIKGMLLRFLSDNKDVYYEMLREHVPLKNLVHLQNRWKN